MMLNIEYSALVIIDVQEKLVMASKYGSEVATNTSKLAKATSILEIPTIITEQYPQGLGQTVSEIQEVLGANFEKFEKKAFSALQEETFAHKINKLKANGTTQIVLCGIETHICVLQTASDLISQGFEVYIVKDACASRNKQEYEAGLELLKQYGAKITCVEITLFEWLKTAKHPKFKEIQALIK